MSKVGIDLPDLTSSRTNATPLMPGGWTPATRHAKSCGSIAGRNSAADGNVRARYRAERSSSCRASRTLGSSSMTAIIGPESGMRDSDTSGLARLRDLVRIDGLVPGDEAHEIGDGLHFELSHDPTALLLDSLLGSAELRGDLLVQASRHDQRQHIPLPRRQFPEPDSQGLVMGATPPRRIVARERLRQRRQQCVIANR